MAPFIPSLASTSSPQLGIFLGFSDPLATSLVAAAGYDFVIIDMEHNPLSAAGATSNWHQLLIRATS
jgi:2-keto-3-deoxy-L-rhamnonate aldolase RhmA